MGRMTSHILWKINMFQTTNQISFYSHVLWISGKHPIYLQIACDFNVTPNKHQQTILG